uniref:Uncharacterized protein n=1 Tax=Moniliophthora roreri TaxID=221103 RepID=A0A0W0FSZ5_MONRR
MIIEQSSSEVNIGIRVKAGDLLIKNSPAAKQYAMSKLDRYNETYEEYLMRKKS